MPTTLVVTELCHVLASRDPGTKINGEFRGYLTRRGDYRISNRKSKIFEKQS
jgi:hypothetical protein